MPVESSRPQPIRSGDVFAANLEILAALAKDTSTCISGACFGDSTLTVSDAGPCDAEVMLVGERPGTQEDTTGLPLIDSADKLLHKALRIAGLYREEVYLTNVTKHFRWETADEGKAHQTPTSEEAQTCHRWLAAEIRLIQPLVIVCLGPTATRAVPSRQITANTLGDTSVIGPHGGRILSTHHPAAILRIYDHDERTAALESFIRTLMLAKASTSYIRPSRARKEHPHKNDIAS